MNEQYELYHHGIRGMKWGVRRFQKADGSLTSAGKKRYSTTELKKMSKQVGEYNRGKYLIRQKTNREISKHNEWYDSASKKVYDNRLGKSQKETDKAFDKIGKELDRRIEESRRKQVGKEKDLADKLSKKYGIDVNVSMKEIQKGSAPYRIAMARVGDLLKKNNER